jgi:hypothetical protein
LREAQRRSNLPHAAGECFVAFPVRVGRVNGAAILSELRSLDYQARSIQFEGKLPGAGIAEANRRVRMIFP